ncbi:MAG: tetratricopeptide repeat protein, partial [Deltaproteobacteria bacterium]|nr:tetratricopeptide repeat protein [Deltaproteobacteria bacterium]
MKTSYGLARLYFKKEYYQLSKDNYIKILNSHKERMPDEDLEQIYCALGEISLKLNQLDDARNYFEKTLAINPANVWAVEQLLAEAEKRNDTQGVVKYRYELVKLKADPFEKFAILLETADIYKERLKNNHGAVAAIKEALRYNPTSKIALLKLFEIYFELGSTEDAIGILGRLAEAEESKEKRALHYLRIAAIYREQLKNDLKAAEFFNLVLDTDFEKLEAFRAIDEILTKLKDWEALARSYRAMIERIRGKGFNDLE